MINDTPDNLKNLINGQFIFVPISSLPYISLRDYNDGYINRYFVGRINFTDVYETNFNDYSITDRKFYRKHEIKWKITGSEYNIYNNRILLEEGVVDYNLKKIKELENIFKDIRNVLNNPKQFWSGY